ncbi:MAG: hypothetical protein FWD33_00745 [Alphaproteobacteria bacterium]|nr:hypothetical protein [Alphaproteobacteria bacterium]
MKKFLNIGTLGLVGIHSICCGLPILAAIFGAASPFAGLISHTLKDILLIVASVAVAASWIIYFKYKDSCNKTVLILSTVLLGVMLAMKIFGGGCDGH